MKENYKDGASLSEIRSMTLEDIRQFIYGDALDMEYVRVDKWFAGAVLAFALLPIIIGMCFASYHVEYEGETPRTATILQTATVYSDDFYEGGLRNGVEEVFTLKKGSEVTLLACDFRTNSFWVETADGDRGIIKAEAIGQYQKDHTFSSDVTPEYIEYVKGLPRYIGGRLRVFPGWVESNIVQGETTLDDIQSHWWGKHTAMHHAQNGDIVAYYPIYMHIDGEERGPMRVTFRDGVIVDATTLHSKEIKPLFDVLPGTGYIVNSDAYVWFNANDLTDDPDFADSNLPEWIRNIVTVDESGAIQVEGWLSWVIIIPLGIIALIIFVYHIISCFLLVPTMVMFLGRVKFLPSFIFELLLFASCIYSAAILYVWWGGFGWILSIIIGVFALWQITRWSAFLNYNYCGACHSFYTLDEYDLDASSHDYTLVTKTFEVTKRGNTEIDRRQTGEKREKRTAWACTVYLQCSRCGHRTTVKHSGDRKA